MRVLLVDDSSRVRERLAQLLREDDDCEHVDEAGDAEDALAKAQANAPNVIVLDLNMPGVGGLAMLPRFKSLSPPPIVIVLTNHAGESHEREARARGADFFFDKSKDFDRVARVIADHTRTSMRDGSTHRS